MEIFSLTKAKILQRTTTYEILNHFLKPYHSQLRLRQGQHISNPFILPRKQETPSFNIYYSRRTREWRYKDFASDDEGSPFDLVMNLHQCSFSEALSIINREMNLGLIGSKSINSRQRKVETNSLLPETINHKTVTYSLLSNQLTPDFLTFWQKLGVNKDLLKKYGVISVKEYTAISRLGKSYTVRATQSQPIFAYKINSLAHKLYFPNAKRYRFLYLGRKPESYVFGYDQLPPKGNSVILTGGEKDVITLSGLGCNAISLNSETAIPPLSLIKELKQRFKKIAILYDSDETGISKARQLQKEFSFELIELPPMNAGKGHKDISDYIKWGYSKQKLDKILRPF